MLHTTKTTGFITALDIRRFEKRTAAAMHDSVWYTLKTDAASVIINSESYLQHLFQIGKKYSTERFLERDWQNKIQCNDIKNKATLDT
jgi:hypothetical protein